MSNVWVGYRQEGLAIKETDVKFYNVNDKPFKIYGLPKNADGFRRVPNVISEKAPGVRPHCFTPAGVRVRFVTDSPYIAIRTKHENYNFGSPNMSKIGAAGFDIYVNKNERQIYAGTFRPPLDIDDGYEGIIYLSDGLKEITLYFPVLCEIYELEIGIKETSILKEHPDYKYEKPVVFYGSSITQGIAASRPANIYECFISRDLDCDIYNLGFSGNCKGEPVLAEYIATLDMTAFVYDYDHNAPDIEHLENTHENFYKIIRKAKPDLPIILTTMPDVGIDEEWQKRRTVIMNTFMNARNNGDQNIFFIDGHSFFPTDCRGECTADGCHPNDLGMYFMAKSIGGMVKEILDK